MPQKTVKKLDGGETSLKASVNLNGGVLAMYRDLKAKLTYPDAADTVVIRLIIQSAHKAEFPSLYPQDEGEGRPSGDIIIGS
ncbi:hypothetical protein FTO68_06190 [Methanocalculus taiwanensis]|uniref:Uncharacterized protein n=1 Tax=Methanocalculus taiwanensis TaxID=106207 RepID=A0ABD4TLE4_9EURY|nr:hypothetical protein [Methanocalculus taiwanensis]MCQ1538574.1 hypothetical protein [Methanocalculus taiwanensis]